MLRAKDSFAGDLEGPFVIAKGQTIDEDHPIVSKYPDMFGDVRADIQWHGQAAPVEQATAAPGELRHVVPAPSEEDEGDLSATSPTPAEERAEEVNPDDYTLPELKALALQAKVDSSGTKKNIADRLNARHAGE